MYHHPFPVKQSISHLPAFSGKTELSLTYHPVLVKQLSLTYHPVLVKQISLTYQLFLVKQLSLTYHPVLVKQLSHEIALLIYFF